MFLQDSPGVSSKRICVVSLLRYTLEFLMRFSWIAQDEIASSRLNFISARCRWAPMNTEHGGYQYANIISNVRWLSFAVLYWYCVRLCNKACETALHIRLARCFNVA